MWFSLFVETLYSCEGFMWPLLPEGPWVFHYSHCNIHKRRYDRVKPQFACVVNLFLVHHLKTCTPISACSWQADCAAYHVYLLFSFCLDGGGWNGGAGKDSCIFSPQTSEIQILAHLFHLHVLNRTICWALDLMAFSSLTSVIILWVFFFPLPILTY